ncbi:hypothetical protein IFM89_019190 [Coptis chinensis]|uniref:Uncharacterized protein n=1 Tax=Coptis chinensis TaxID=261450 RepID=A0A835M300_9MAGN|nr:hypothetical protein IFM89_019190 [Coptis chinensis]
MKMQRSAGIYGFYDECKEDSMSASRKIFTDRFNRYSVAAALIDEKILCMHGGLSPKLKNLNQIRDIQGPVRSRIVVRSVTYSMRSILGLRRRAVKLPPKKDSQVCDSNVITPEPKFMAILSLLYKITRSSRT